MKNIALQRLIHQQQHHSSVLSAFICNNHSSFSKSILQTQATQTLRAVSSQQNQSLLLSLSASFSRSFSSSSSSSSSSSKSHPQVLLLERDTTEETHEEKVNRIEQSQLNSLVESYRRLGHFASRLDPLQLGHLQSVQVRQLSELSLEHFGFSEQDLEKEFNTAGILRMPSGSTRATLNEIVSHLKQTYCTHIAYEFNHIPVPAEKSWFEKRIESVDLKSYFSPAQKRNIHSILVKSEVFDKFMTVKFASFKRYGMEGAESAMAGLEAALVRASQQQVDELVIGMPHRGRFNILIGLLDYPARAFFRKITGQSDIPIGMDGIDDVPSHIAQSITKKFDQQNEIHVSLIHNPSHLEAVNPVSQGKTRAKQDSLLTKLGHKPPFNNVPKDSRNKKLCIQLHGDAAFAGQGVVTEALQLANLPHYTTGGTVHMIVNNQIGFTTPPVNGRSFLYSSDVAHLIHAPIIHVNAEHPEAVAYVCQLAIDYRQHFHKDIIIDIIGYRRHGHNEVDEPSFTQPIMYKNIRARQTVATTYAQQLAKEGLVNNESIEKLTKKLQEFLQNELIHAKDYKPSADRHFQNKWKGYAQPSNMNDSHSINTGVESKTLKQIALDSVVYPSNMTIHPRLERTHVQARIDAVNKGNEIDWATAEAMAWGSLMLEGYNVRISGQDVERGTFSQRHGVLIDQNSQQTYAPLNYLSDAKPDSGVIQYCSSPLSEFAVMGYEYGISMEDPKQLVIWEAQFGDFFNGAQIIIDTYLANGEAKWLRQSGLVVLLPHGFDGAGPEHSSCRIERFLQLCDGSEFEIDNRPVCMSFANPTTPANYFHLIRRQMKRDYRRPLVVAAPKTLLRHASAISSFESMAPGTHFQPVLADSMKPHDGVTTIAFCSGKLFYDLERTRGTTNRQDIALIRLEELSPFPFNYIQQTLSTYNLDKVKRIVWIQEEPANAGAWFFVRPRLQTVCSQAAKHLNSVEYSGRPASPGGVATGIGVVHKKEQDQVINTLFTIQK